MGGMAAQIPIKNDPEANERRCDKVRQDKLREVAPGTTAPGWRIPGLVPVAKEVFDEHMPHSNQISMLRERREGHRGRPARVPKGEITEAGLR